MRPYRPSLRSGERGQASVELVAAVPALLVLGLVVLQLLAVGYAATLAGAAAEAGALAHAADGDPKRAAREAVPGWSRARMQVAVKERTVRVVMRPPSPIPAVARALEISASASGG